MSSSIAFGAALCASGVPQSSDHSAFSMPKGTQTWASSLRLLANEDPSCLFIVRRINKLGFKAPRILRQHFSAHGAVVRVLVAQSRCDSRAKTAVRYDAGQVAWALCRCRTLKPCGAYLRM